MKDKLLRLISKIDISMLAFVALTGRIVLNGAGFGEAFSLCALAAVYGFHKYLYRRNELWNIAVENELRSLRKDVESVSNKVQGKVIYESQKQEKLRRF